MDVRSPASRTIPLSGSLDMYSADEFHRRVTVTIDEGSHEHLVIDLTELSYLSFEGLAVLVSVHEHARRSNRSIRIEGHHGQPADVIELSGLTVLLTTAATTGAAPPHNQTRSAGREGAPRAASPRPASATRTASQPTR